MEKMTAPGTGAVIFSQFVVKAFDGYQGGAPVVPARVQRLAGIISIAYAGFGLMFVGRLEFERRLQLGYRLLGEAGV